MKESEKIQFWLMVSVVSFIGFKIINHKSKKTQNSDSGLGTKESRLVSPESIVDIRAAPGVSRVTL